MWLTFAFISATLLGMYEVFKKMALEGNAVIPVLFLNTVFCSLLFLQFGINCFQWFNHPVNRMNIAIISNYSVFFY